VALTFSVLGMNPCLPHAWQTPEFLSQAPSPSVHIFLCLGQGVSNFAQAVLELSVFLPQTPE
jgi:hypothetical protein